MQATYIGDRSNAANELEEQDFALFTCPDCQYQVSIAADWDGYQMRAKNEEDLICPKCSGEMER